MKFKKENIQNIRAFNRYYTSLIGLLDGHLLDSEFSLAEARILYEIYNNSKITASQIILILNMDKGYISRILKKFEKNGLIEKQASDDDARVYYIKLSNEGLNIFHHLNDASNDQIENMILKLSTKDTLQLVNCMKAIMQILQKSNVQGINSVSA